MNRNIVVNFLETTSPAELFYQLCQEKQYSAEQIRSIQKTLSSRPSFPDGTAIPQIIRNSNIAVLPEDDSVSSIGRNRVLLLRHERFAPPVMHSHDCFEALYVLSGTCQHYIFQTKQFLQTGDLILLSPNAHHSVYADSDSIVIQIRISRSVIEDLHSNMVQRKTEDAVSSFFCSSIYQEDYRSYLLFHTALDEDTRNQILDMFLEEFQPDEYADYTLTHMLILFLIKLIRKYRKTAEGPAFVPPSYTESSYIYHYIRSNYATASLNHLAQQLNYSVPYCSKYVRSCTGKSFSDLLRQIRFEAATEYLLKSDLTVEHISERIGYANPENFMRMFKKTYGVSPTQFRSQRIHSKSESTPPSCENS